MSPLPAPGPAGLGELARESELLRCCARVQMDAARAARIRTLCREPLNWDGLIELACRHGVEPLLHRHLSAVCPERVPETVAGRLRERFRANGARNRFLLAQLMRVVGLLEAAGIPAIAYKGPTLAVGAYGDLALRRFADLDLLLRKQDILPAKALLGGHGYTPRYDLTAIEEATFLNAQYELILDRHRGGITVELHWDLMPKEFAFRPDLAGLWRSAERISLGGMAILTLAAEDLLLVLCVHGAKHFWERLGWIVDVAEILRARPDLNWAVLVERARRADGERMLLLGLWLAHILIGVELPGEIIRRIQVDRSVPWLARRVGEWQAGPEPPRPGLVQSELFYLKARQGLARRVAYVTRRIVIPTIEDWQWRRLPGPLFYLHYALRPIRLAAKYRPRWRAGGDPRG